MALIIFILYCKSVLEEIDWPTSVNWRSSWFHFLPVVLRSLWRRPISEGGGGCTEAPEGASHPPYLSTRIPRAAMAPRKRGGGGRGGLSFIFCCFNSSDHPEITYRLREDFALQVMEPALPMPGYDELDGMFSELVVRTQTSHAQPLFWENQMHTLKICFSLLLIWLKPWCRKVWGTVAPCS